MGLLLQQLLVLLLLVACQRGGGCNLDQQTAGSMQPDLSAL
jgi:hypothetical protein